MSKRKQLREIALSQALDYEKQIPDDVWVDEYLMRGTVTVSGQWIKDVVASLTKKKGK